MTNDVTREEMLARFYEMQESCEQFKVTDNYDRKIELAIRKAIEVTAPKDAPPEGEVEDE